MRHARLRVFFLLQALISLNSLFVYGADNGPSVDELVTRHLDSIGPAAVRSGIKSRVVQGTAVYRILVGGSGSVDGKTGMVSEGHKLRFMTKFPRADYRGEQFVFNDGKMEIAFANSNQTRSPFAEFVRGQDAILREGLFGGSLSTGWALLDVAGRKAKLVYEGVKKIDGRNVHQLRYEPQRRSDVAIRIYLDSETFRHIGTVYTLDKASNVGQEITQSAKQRPERLRLEEKFDDFQEFDGLRLPTYWDIQFTRELPSGDTTVFEWELKEDQISNNVGLDPRNFEVK
jgi:hypothetical protein